MKLHASLRACADLDATETRSMQALFFRHFEGVSETQFLADLHEKRWVVLIRRQGDDEVVGFSSFTLYPFTDGHEPLTVVYSGDTIVDPSAWGSSILARSWIEAVWSVHRAEGRGRLLWLLLSSGFRTYRFLPVFWRQFYPRFDAPTPRQTQRLIDRLARDRFGDAYDSQRGIVRFARPQRLAPHLSGIPEQKLRDLHVAFFARKNPGHAAGDELVCLAELSPDNLTRAGQRMVAAGSARPAARQRPARLARCSG